MVNIMIRWLIAACVCTSLLLASCGSDSPPTTQPPPAPAAGGEGGDCPLTVDELKSATSATWTQATTKKDHPLELLESVKVTACIYTSDELKQEFGGDPLVVRVDVVSPQDAAQVRDQFRTSCTKNSGTERPAAGGTICEARGHTIEGVIGNLNVVMILNADKATAVRLSPSFEKILAAAG